MSDRLRMTGMISGMDTESIIQSLVSAKSQKVTTLKNDQKKLEWKQTAWQDLNKRIYSFYTGTLSNMRLSSSYAKKTTKISDSTKASVIASDGAVNGTQTLKVKSVAKSGYLTGTRLPEHVSYDDEGNKIKGYRSTDKLSAINPDLVGSSIYLTVGTGDEKKDTEFKITGDMTINEFIGKLKEGGVNASFDEGNQRFFVAATGTGKDKDFTLMSSNLQHSDSRSALSALGLDVNTRTLSGSKVSFNSEAKDAKWQAGTALTDISGVKVGDVIEVNVGGQTTKITIDTTEDTTTDPNDMKVKDVAGLVNAFKQAGLDASFDYQGSHTFTLVGADGKDFSLKAGTSGSKVLSALGIASNPALPNKIDAQDAMIELNGVEFTSESNTFSVNGLTITASALTGEDEELTITTETDYNGIYDMIKDFVDEYNDIINEMYKLYNADSARKYSMLTDEQKESMTDDEVEKWEDTIKGSLLRKDNDLYKIMSTMRDSINKGYTAALDENGDPIKSDPLYGKTWYIFDFGIGTLNYFEAEENERYALHIDGDSDDDKTSTKEDKLKSAIAKDPEGTIAFFSALCKDMYDAIGDTMKRTNYRSSYKVYDDKRLQTEYDDYTSKIKKAEDALADYEDKWYDKFGSMETALSKLQNTQNSISSLFGM